MCQKSLSGQIRSYCKKLTNSRTNRIVMYRHVLRTSLRCCFIHRCLDKSDCIAISLIASRTNRFVMHRNAPVAPLRRCVITCCLDKLDRIGIETCYVFHLFHCAPVSPSDIFETAVSIAFNWSIPPKLSRQMFFRVQNQLFRKYPMMTQRRSETHSTSLCQYDLISPDSKL